MKRFRIRDNVPDTYVKRSRDFQLLCDLFDIVNNGVKFDIDSIMDLSNTQLTRESMLPYLQSKLGFNSSKEIPQDTLRTLLKCFPYLNKHKGSRRGIEEAICLFLNVIYARCRYEINIYNNSNNSITGNYFILVSLKDNVLKNLNILNDLLKYVLPTGYVLNYQLAYEIDDIRTNIDPQDKITITLVNEQFSSKARAAYRYEDENGDYKKTYTTSDKTADDQQLPGVIGAVGTTVIAVNKNPYLENSDAVDITVDSYNQFNITEGGENK